MKVSTLEEALKGFFGSRGIGPGDLINTDPALERANIDGYVIDGEPVAYAATGTNFREGHRTSRVPDPKRVRKAIGNAPIILYAEPDARIQNDLATRPGGLHGLDSEDVLAGSEFYRPAGVHQKLVEGTEKHEIKAPDRIRATPIEQLLAEANVPVTYLLAGAEGTQPITLRLKPERNQIVSVRYEAGDQWYKTS